ncbi:hypothetical protein F2Q69_00002319 [Brassica cretica]|uniref:S-locus glycoprotein domain-containing protein n=1 Tax=Brassica cretica TaxID=69181 RepID=A0A8S9P0E9_BRACR|nr:hypothetical protein F2Q69_00002319 [Brassica cretica]
MQRSGPWNGMEFSGIPEVQGLNYMVYNYTENSEEISYTFHMTNQSIYSRLTVSDYTLNRFTWIPPSWGWSLFWTLPTDRVRSQEPAAVGLERRNTGVCEDDADEL